MIDPADNFRKIRESIPDHVVILAAAKTRSAGEIEPLIDAGLTDIGENYVQEAETVRRALGEKGNRLTWHMIGHVQTNKINKSLALFDVIQTVESAEKARAIDLRAERLGMTVSVLIEVNIGGEHSKSGAAAELDTIEGIVRDASRLSHLRVKGLMTMGPLTARAEDLRPYFRKTKVLYDQLGSMAIPGVSMDRLSMGMSDSFRVAIEEGANMVRLGTIIFGPR
jgi:pyridoxal phosphate enzyme (YggS family)